MQFQHPVNNRSAVKIVAALAIAAICAIAACSKAGKRITIGKSNENDEATAGASDLDNKLSPILDKERKCLPLKEISMELLESNTLFSVYTSSLLLGKDKGTEFDLIEAFGVQLAGLKKHFPVQYSVDGDELGKGELADLLSVVAQDECETVTFQPQNGSPVVFTNRDSDSVLRDSMTLVNRDRQEVRQYILSRLKPGLLKVITQKIDKVQSCGSAERTVIVRHELHVSWGSNLATVSLASNYADFLNRALSNPPQELDDAIEGNKLSSRKDSKDDKEDASRRPSRPTSSQLYVSISYPVFDIIKNLVEMGDIRSPQCKKR